jgi:predicted acyltransferase (DUF342 family)
MPTVVFLVVYLSHLLRLGEEEAAERLVDDVAGRDDDGPDPLVIPRGATITDDAWRVSTPAEIGSDCRLNGNVRATEIEVGAGTEVYGSLRARDDVSVGSDAIVHGDVTTRGGQVRIAPGAQVRGDVACDTLSLDDGEVDGAIRARGEVTMGGDSVPGA